MISHGAVWLQNIYKNSTIQIWIILELDGNGKDTRKEREEGRNFLSQYWLIEWWCGDEKCQWNDRFFFRVAVIIIIISFYSLVIFVAHLNAELNEKKQKILQKQSWHTYSPSCAHQRKVSENVWMYCCIRKEIIEKGFSSKIARFSFSAAVSFVCVA